MVELGVNDLSKVYEMTIAEFRIRRHGYVREQQHDWAKFRLVAYNTLLSFNIDAKKIPKSPEKMLPLPLVDDAEKEQTTKQMAEKFKDAVKQYNQLKNLKRE